MYKDVAVVIIGYDGYIDVWNHSINLLNKYWYDRPETYLVSACLKPSYDNVNVLCAGEGSEWSLKVQYALEHIKKKYIILMLEDFFISDFVDNNQMNGIMEMIDKNEIKYYQLSVQLINAHWEKGQKFNGNRNIKIIPADKKYGLNLQAAVWDTEFLKKVVGKGNYNTWQFEINQLGSKKYNLHKVEYLIDVSNPLKITHMIVQSKYLPGSIKKINRIGYKISNEERECLNFKDNFKYNFKLLMYSLTPKFLIKPFKRIGKLLKIDFVTDRLSLK